MDKPETEKSALCHVAKNQLCFCRVYLAAYRHRLCLSLLSLSGSFWQEKTRVPETEKSTDSRKICTVPCSKRSIMFLLSLFSRISSSSSSLSLCSLLSGSFCVANCQRGWCEARHLPSKLTRQLLTRNYMHLWAAYFTNGFYMTPSKRCINYTHQSTNLATKSWLKQFSTRKVL